MEVEISDPGEGGKQVVVPTRERKSKRIKSSMLAVKKRSGSKREGVKFDEEPSRSSYGEEANTSFAGISRGEKTVMDEGGNIQCNEDVILEESEEEAKSGAADWLVEEKEIEVLNMEKSMQC